MHKIVLSKRKLKVHMLLHMEKSIKISYSIF